MRPISDEDAVDLARHEHISLTAGDMSSVGYCLRGPQVWNAPARRWEVVPRSTAPDDIQAARIAERLLNA